MFLKSLFIVIFSFLVVGCSTSTKYNKLEVQDAQIVRFKVPSELTGACVVDKPLQREAYLLLQPHEREQYLTDYSVKLMGVIKDCNIKLKKIEELSNAQP